VISLAIATVTYGDRAHYLRKLIASIDSNLVSQIYVVDNGCEIPITIDVLGFSKVPITIVRQSQNGGSAGGFSVALHTAYSQSHDFILLIDDDNSFDKGAINSIIEYATIVKCENKKTILFIPKSSHSKDDLDGYASANVPGSIRGFDIATKISRILTGRVKSIRKGNDLKRAPYSGLLIPGRLIQDIGLPDTRFYLYLDDIEYTERAVSNGYTIRPLGATRIIDNDCSWWKSDVSHLSNLKKWIYLGSDIQSYYSMRNGVFLDHRLASSTSKMKLKFCINLIAYYGLLAFTALMSNRLQRLVLLTKAMAAGVSGIIGKVEMHE
jgi:GT2 family glycosyltransferase